MFDYDIKVKIRNEKQSEEIQNIMFEYGYYWGNKNYSIKYSDKPFLYFSSDKEIYFGNSIGNFEKDEALEIKPKEIIINHQTNQNAIKSVEFNKGEWKW